MLTRRVFQACGLCTTMLLGACGRTQEPPQRHAYTLGGTPLGAPLAAARTDTGILQDQKTYQPASFVGGGGAAAGSGTIAATDAATAARQMVNELLNSFEDGEVQYVLDVLDPEQVKVLADDDEFLYNTQGRLKTLMDLLAKTFGDSSREQLSSDLRKLLSDKLSVDPVNADTVNVTPNPLVVVLGLAKAPPAMTLVRKGGTWKVRLEAALTAADRTAIVGYHGTLQAALDKLIEALANNEITSREQVYQALLQAAQGQELDLSGGKPPEEVEPQPEAEGEPKPEGAPGRGRPPPRPGGGPRPVEP